MAAKSPGIEVSPAVIRWARESVGASVADVAHRLKVPPKTVQSWETGEEAPSLRDLEALASFCRRPLAALFLSKPPEEPSLPHDFRAAPGQSTTPLSRKSLIIIRRTQRLQALGRGLLADLGLSAKAPVAPASVDSDPEQMAYGERRRLAVTVEQQRAWRNSYEAFGAWRAAIEGIGVLVFRFSMPLGETRGFSLTREAPPVIVVNSADDINPRVFTLLHEYAHVLLHRGGLCLFEEADDPHIPAVESFCNHFAAAFLVPREAFLGDEVIRASRGPATLPDQDLQRVAARFRVSRYVIWRRLFDLCPFSSDAYWDRINRWRAEATQARPRTGRAATPAVKCVRERGRKFVSLVVSATDRKFMTYRDALDCLSIGARDLGKLRALVEGGRRT